MRRSGTCKRNSAKQAGDAVGAATTPSRRRKRVALSSEREGRSGERVLLATSQMAQKAVSAIAIASHWAASSGKVVVRDGRAKRATAMMLRKGKNAGGAARRLRIARAAAPRCEESAQRFPRREQRSDERTCPRITSMS